MLACSNFFLYCKCFLVDVTVTVVERGQAEKGVKENPTPIWSYLCGILLNSFPGPNFSSTSVFSFFPILMVGENCVQSSAKKIGLLISKLNKEISKLNTESFGFPRNYAGVRHCVILVAPRRVRKINYSTEVGTSEHRVLKFGLKEI